MSYPQADPHTRFRILLSSSLLFLGVAVFVLGGLVWYYTEWGLGEVNGPRFIGEEDSASPWDYLGMVFLTCMMAPVVGLGYDPLLRHLAVVRRTEVNITVSMFAAVPFWYVSYLPTILMAISSVDGTTLRILLLVPLLASGMTGFLQFLMVQFIMARSRDGLPEMPEEEPPFPANESPAPPEV